MNKMWTPYFKKYVNLWMNSRTVYVKCEKKVPILSFHKSLDEINKPGGPWKRTPLGGWIWNFSNTSLYSIGNTTISLRQRMWLSSPPTWQNLILRSSDIGSTSANVDTICLWSTGPRAWLLEAGIAVALKFSGRHLILKMSISELKLQWRTL